MEDGTDAEFEDALRTLAASIAESETEPPSDKAGEYGKRDEREKEVVTKIRAMLDSAEKGKNILSDEEAGNLLRYQQGPTGSVGTVKTWRSNPRINLQKPALELAMATRNDQEMGWNVRGKNGPDSDLAADMVQGIMEETWTRSAMKEKRLEMTLSGGLFGAAPIMTLFENANDEHPGRNVISVVDLRTCLADPYSANNDDLQSSGAWFRLPMLNAVQIYEKWPKDIRGRETCKLLEDLKAEPSEATAVSREMHRDLFKGEFEHKYPDDATADQFLLVEAWYRDSETVEEPVYETLTSMTVDSQSGDIGASNTERVQTGTKYVSKYPKGRLSIAVLPRTGDPIVLLDEANRYGHIPVVYLQEGMDPTRLIGISMYRNTNELSDTINQLFGCVVDFTKMQAFPKLMLDITRVPEGLEVTDSPGEIIESNGDTTGAAQYLTPGSMAVEVFRAIDMAKQYFDHDTGQYEASRGQKPASVTAAQAIEAIQSVAMLRPKMKNAMMGFALERVARQMLQNLVNFGGIDKRWLSLSGEKGKRLYDRIEAYRQTRIKESQGGSSPLSPDNPMAGLPPYISQVVAYSPDGSPNPSAFHVAWIAQHLRDAVQGMEMEIEVNTPQVKSKVGRAEQALALAPLKDDNGKSLLPSEYLLRALDIPHVDQILAAKASEQNAEQMMQQIKPQFDAMIAEFQQRGIPLPWEKSQQGPVPQQPGPQEVAA